MRSASASAKTPILFDTDIGSDVDDALALALILARPAALDLVAVTTVASDPNLAAEIAASLLGAGGRSDIEVYTEPVGEGIRVDSGVREGGVVSVYYDPLLAKLIAWGEDRARAISRLSEALDAFQIEGIKTSIPFHRRVLRHPVFLEGRYDTGFIDAHMGGA